MAHATNRFAHTTDSAGTPASVTQEASMTDVTVAHTAEDADALASAESAAASHEARGGRDAILELRDVSYRYKPGMPLVLDHVSHSFAAARMHAVVGPSGTGKTTMLSLLSGLAVPTDGHVLYEGRDLAALDRYAYRASTIGVIFQSFNLMPSMTVSENIIMSMKLAGAYHGRKAAREDVLRVLEDVDLPDDYADRRIGHLSGGEQQRVAIARVLSYRPSVIIADEPTGNLDPESTQIIVDIFRGIVEDGRTVIIVTHSREVAAACDDVFDLSTLGKRTRPRKAVRRAPRSAAAASASSR